MSLKGENEKYTLQIWTQRYPVNFPSIGVCQQWFRLHFGVEKPRHPNPVKSQRAVGRLAI